MLRCMVPINRRGGKGLAGQTMAYDTLSLSLLYYVLLSTLSTEISWITSVFLHYCSDFSLSFSLSLSLSLSPVSKRHYITSANTPASRSIYLKCYWGHKPITASHVTDISKHIKRCWMCILLNLSAQFSNGNRK